MILWYLLVKLYKYFKVMFKNLANNNQEQKVQNSKTTNKKINEKDVIDAKFEEIENNEKSSSK